MPGIMHCRGKCSPDNGFSPTSANSKLHSDQDREHPARGYKGKRAATRQYMEYGEEPHSAADKGIVLKATWNKTRKVVPGRSHLRFSSDS